MKSRRPASLLWRKRPFAGLLWKKMPSAGLLWREDPLQGFYREKNSSFFYGEKTCCRCSMEGRSRTALLWRENLLEEEILQIFYRNKLDTEDLLQVIYIEKTSRRSSRERRPSSMDTIPPACFL